jgi:hypothetical protein
MHPPEAIGGSRNPKVREGLTVLAEAERKLGALEPLIAAAMRSVNEYQRRV